MVVISSFIEFELIGVPSSWLNTGVWSRSAAMAQHNKMKEWTTNVTLWGALQRRRANWQVAEESHPQRLVSIHQLRHGVLDDDNLFSSVKPLVDGCKTKLRRKRQNVWGAGLIWNDNPRHCRIEVTQERVAFKVPCKTIIRVERFDM